MSDDDAIQVYDGSGETDVQKKMQKLREAKRAKAAGITSEDKFDLTNIKGDLASSRYFRCKILLGGRTESFHWTTEPNKAGYFVGYRQVWKRTMTGRRVKWKPVGTIDNFLARRKRKDVKSMARVHVLRLENSRKEAKDKKA